MKSQAVHVRNYSFGPQDKLFFDANIWMFLYGPQGQNNLPGNRMSVYSSAFNRILKARSCFLSNLAVALLCTLPVGFFVTFCAVSRSIF